MAQRKMHHRTWDRASLRRELLASKVVKPNGCWEWPFSRSGDGYGHMYVAGKTESVHRVAFYAFKGIVPRICRHRCDNPPCFRPGHLLNGGVSENVLDMVKSGKHNHARKTHCIHGHPFTPENTRIIKGKWRACRECQRIKNRRYKHAT